MELLMNMGFRIVKTPDGAAATAECLSLAYQLNAFHSIMVLATKYSRSKPTITVQYQPSVSFI
jgi:hypothetical protein